MERNEWVSKWMREKKWMDERWMKDGGGELRSSFTRKVIIWLGVTVKERWSREEDGMWEEYQCIRPNKEKMKEERLRQRPRLAVSLRLLAPRPQVLTLLPPLCSKTCFFYYSCNLFFIPFLFNPSLTSTLLEEQQICGWGPEIWTVIISKSFSSQKIGSQFSKFSHQSLLPSFRSGIWGPPTNQG